MNVQELIDELNKVEDKTQEVKIHINYGMGCWTRTSDLDISEEDVYDEEGEETGETYISISGEEEEDGM